jgi:hypothetical protein
MLTNGGWTPCATPWPRHGTQLPGSGRDRRRPGTRRPPGSPPSCSGKARCWRTLGWTSCIGTLKPSSSWRETKISAGWRFSRVSSREAVSHHAARSRSARTGRVGRVTVP